MRPGGEHDTTCLREHSEMLPALRDWTGDNLPALADLGYEGEAPILVLPIKKPADRVLTDDQRQHNWLQAYARASAEQANALLKTTFTALRPISLSPDVIVAAALVLLHTERRRTT